MIQDSSVLPLSHVKFCDPIRGSVHQTYEREGLGQQHCDERGPEKKTSLDLSRKFEGSGR
jgi:hypothetical protein